MEKSQDELMASATEARRKARRAFQKMRNSCSLTNGEQDKSKTASLSTKRSEDDWEKCHSLHIDLLDREQQLLELAASGVIIQDNAARCEKINKDPKIFDICYELDQLFQCVVSKPTAKLRQYLNNTKASSRKRSWAHSLLSKVLHHPLRTLFKTADALGKAFLESMDVCGSHQRLRLALQHTLMYISDCYRYALEHQKSRNAAEFMRILVPDDPESHMRLGINVSMLTDSAEALVPFYYYCVFLANREVDVNHPEAVVVSRFVQSVRRTELGDDENDLATRRRFAVLFVDALWSILKTDFDRANEKIKEKRLWDTLGQYLMGVPSEGEILHVIGALIFVHHRVSPLGNQDGKILLQCDLTDFAARKAIEILSKHVAQSLSKFNAAVRTRKRNRRRALQKKKRRRDGTPMEPGVADSVTRDLLKEIINLEKSVPHLGALSFLTHYWSVSRAAPKQTSEFPGLAAALRNMTEVVQELDKLAEVTGSVSIIGQVATKVFGGTSGQIPALLEDIMFSAFSPCRNVNMFRNIRMQDVPFPSLLGTPRTDFVRSAMLEVGNGTYESVVGGIARRHLEAFAQLCNTEAGGRAIDKDAMAALVTVAIRKLRIQRLVRGLEKTGGGRVLRMANTTPQASRGEPVSQQQASELFPPAGQPDPNEDSSLQQEISSGELAVRLKKRRRVIGTSSLAFADREDTGSLSCRSSEEKGSESLFMPRPQSNIANSEARQQNPEDGMMEEPASRAGDGGRIRRGVSRGSLLSQGSLQLCYAQPPEPNNQNKQDSSKETASKESDSASLSRILRDILYPKNSVIISPPRNLSGPAFWRSSPSQEYAQNIVRIGAVIEDQVK